MKKDFASFAAQWGCDPVYDKPPRKPGDGYLFYNFGVEGHDPVFLKKFLPAINRTICECKRDEAEIKRDVRDLLALKYECRRRLTESEAKNV